MSITLILSAALATFLVPPDPAREDALFAAIAEDIGDHRIVALGEASHGDGSTFTFKVRLIDYLHRERGFDVLAFESGLWSLEEAQQDVDEGMRPSQALRSAIFPLWADAEQFSALYEILDASTEAAPITLAGFDFQPTGKDKARLIVRLRTMASELGGDGAPIARLADAIEAMIEDRVAGLEAIDLEQVEADRLAALAVLKSSDKTSAMDVRIVDSVARFLRFAKRLSGGMENLPDGALNDRDAAMADNLVALATQIYPDRKFLLWGATSHFLKDRTAISVESDAAMVPMGAHLASGPLGDDYYVLGFSALSGQVGSMRRPPFDLPEAEADTLEARVMAANPGQSAAFVGLPACGNPRQRTRALGHAQWDGDWGCALDGLVVFRAMEPTRYAAP